MCIGHKIAGALVLVGALNWGLVGAFKFNLVMAILGNGTTLERLVYILVGLSAVMVLMMCHCKMCKMGGCSKDGKEGGCCGGGTCTK